MMAKSHVLLGASAWVAYSVVAGAPLELPLVALSSAASLLPDMDHPKSVFGSLIKPVSIFISGIFGHRGITHSLLAIFILSWVAVKYGDLAGHTVSAICIGYLSHLMADFFTPQGVPLLYPVKKKFSFPITVNTGGLSEYVAVMSVTGFTVLYVMSPRMADGLVASVSSFVNLS